MCYKGCKSPNMIKLNPIWNVIALSRLILYLTEFRLVQNQSGKINNNPNSVCINCIEKLRHLHSKNFALFMPVFLEKNYSKSVLVSAHFTRV